MNLNQITVPTLDISTSIDFYTKLGLTLIVHSSDEYARFVCPDGNSTFSVQKVKQLHPTGIKVYFEVKELDQKVEQLIKQGINIDVLLMDDFYRLIKQSGHYWLIDNIENKNYDGTRHLIYLKKKV